MNEEAVINLVSLVKTSLLARMRTDLKTGESIDQILNRYEYASYALQDGNLVMITTKRDKEEPTKK
jgi:hypothetical protein